MPEFSCPSYVVGVGRRCVHYLGGACARPDEFMCVEWLRANGYRAPTAERATSPPGPVPRPVQIGLFPRLRPPRNQ